MCPYNSEAPLARPNCLAYDSEAQLAGPSKLSFFLGNNQVNCLAYASGESISYFGLGK